MLDLLPMGAFLGGVLAALSGSISVRRAATLEGKLAELRYMLWVGLAMLAVCWVGLITASRKQLGVLAARTPGQPATATDVSILSRAASDAWRDHTLQLAGLVFVVLCMMPAVLHVLRELQSFVLAQRTDMLARDQAALARSEAPR